MGMLPEGTEVDKKMKMIAAFLKDQRGSSTVEFVIWIPLFVFFLAATIDASMLYLTQTEMWNVARDTARRVTTGQLPTEQAAKDYAAELLTIGGNTYWIVPTIDQPNQEVTVRIGTFIHDADAFGVFGWFGQQGILTESLESQVTMRLEPS